jgi:photosystem II stability/assembly factor-like uncharacterized protein
MCYPEDFWKRINSPTTQNLISIAFIDSLTGWVSSDSGKIFHTSDGGENWDEQFSNDSLNINSLFFLNEQVGWGSAVSFTYEPYGTFVLTTTDGGTNWNSEYLRLGQVFINSFYFFDTLTGFTVGSPNVFHKTTNGGSSWEKVKLDSSAASGFPPFTVKFHSPQYGYACGGLRDAIGVVWRTTDGGENWTTVVDTLAPEPFYDIQIFDSLHVLVVGGDPEYGASYVVTYDGGETWEYVNLGILGYPVDVGFRTAAEGWMPMGYQKIFLLTSDSGESWIEVNTPDSTDILRICFIDSSHGFGVGSHGSIIKYIPQKPTDVKGGEEIISSFNLQQNYPNPFNPSTTIEYSIAEDGFVKLAVYNLLGEEVATLVNTQQKAGSYEVNFNARGLSSGVYLYRIEAANYTASKKFVLMK